MSNGITIQKLSKVLKYIFKCSTGRCPVCGKRTVFILTDTLEKVRNHAFCLRCRSSSRNRHLAKCIVDAYFGVGIKDLADFKKHQDMVILNTSYKSPIANQLGNSANIYNTEYYDHCKSGEYYNGVRCENLQQLSFENNSIDLVITEDVLEHVTDLEACFREIHRVLKPGGFHAFTIPFSFDKKTVTRYEKRGDEFVPIVLPIEYHGDNVRGRIPAFYNIGIDLFEMLDKIGYTTDVTIAQLEDYQKYGAFNSFTFISKKK